MPGTGKREFPCILCRKRTKPTERRTLTAELKQLVQKMCVSDPSDEDVLCTACRIKCHVKLKKHIEKKDTAPKDTLFSPQQQGSSSRYARSPPSVTLPLPSSATSHARCFICKRPGPKLIVVPTSERNSVFLHQKILIPYGSRCCSKHIPDGMQVYLRCSETDSRFLTNIKLKQELHRRHFTVFARNCFEI